MQRCFLLGGRGFIGSRLSYLLTTKGVSWVAPDSNSLNLIPGACVSKLKKLYKEGDCLIILAALAPYRGRDVKTFCDNMRIADNIHKSIDSRISSIVYISSDAVYEKSQEIVQDGTLPSPSSLYGMMHRSRELLFKDFSEKLLILRPTMVFGNADPHDAYGPSKFLRTSLESGEIVLFGEGEERRDYIGIDDIASLIVSAINRSLRGKFNIANGTSHSYRAIADIILSKLPNTRLKFVPRREQVLHRQYPRPKIWDLLDHQPVNIACSIEKYFKDFHERI